MIVSPYALEWYSRREKQKNCLKFLDALFLQQRAFIDDPAKRKSAICSRRAGKSHGAGSYLAKETLDNVEGDCAYIGLTRSSAKKIMFNPLERLNRKYSLGFEFNRSDLSATAPNGNTIYMTGAHNEEDTEKLRGLKLKLIVLDECASFKAHLNYLIEEVLEPTLIDTNGTLALIGTPSANPGPNYFYRATEANTEGYSVHKWTILDNPFIPHAKQWLEEYKKKKGWQEDHPIYRREWLGQWTLDADSLVYKFKKDRNEFVDLPNHKFSYVIGIDLGSVDAFTMVVLAYSEDSPILYEVDTFKRSGLIPAEMAEFIIKWRDKYRPVSIVADHGGLGKAICEEFQRRYHIVLKPAEKAQKLANIELCNGDLISGRIKIRSQALKSELLMLQWDPDKPDKEDPRTPNDCCDSFLYSYREARHYLGVYKDAIPKMGSKEWADKEAEDMLKKDLEMFEKEQQEMREYGF